MRTNLGIALLAAISFGAWADVLQQPIGILNTREPILAVPETLARNTAQVELGRRLYFDRRLSASGQRSCNDCHNVDTGGTLRQPRPAASDGTTILRNVPSIYNIRLLYLFNWDGAFNQPRDAISACLLDPARMGTTHTLVRERLAGDISFSRAFQSALGREVDIEGVGEALHELVYTLTTPGSRFDRYLAGEMQVLSNDEIEGYQLFKSYGCDGCHNGAAIGGGVMQNTNLFGDLFEEHEEMDERDLGRYLVTSRERDRYMFRVPGLRNVELTAPYYKDGSLDDLEEAVEEMAEHQLGIELPEEQIRKITAFLKTLTGTMPELRP